MKKTIKLFAFILATLMLVSFIPLAAFAEEIETGAENTETETLEGSSPEQEEAVSEPEDTSQHENNGFSLPEDSENVHYERLPNGFIKVTVYPNVTDSDSMLIPGQMGTHLGGATPMAFGPGFDETIIDGGATITYPNDTYISSLSPLTNYGSATEAYVSDDQFLYISYPMPYVPDYATMVEATLNIAYLYKSSQSARVSAYRVNVNWNEDTLTWSSAQQSYGMGIDSTSISFITISDTAGASLTTPRFVQFDILEAAEAWHSGEAQNYGVALKSLGQTVRFKTSEAAVSYRPYFEYVYSIPAPLDNGTYRIHNVETERYIDIKDASTNYGAYITQDAFNDAARQEWILNFGSDGYYTIKSVHSNKYIGLDISDLNNIKQYTSPTDYCKWAIRETTSGNYIFVCKGTDEDEYVLSAISCFSGDGSVLIGKAYTDNGDYNDEWNLGIPVRFEDIHLNVGETTTVNIQADCPAGYVNVTDYRYTILDNGDEYISINNITGEISAIDVDDDIYSADVITVVATHKEYAISYSFKVYVFVDKVYIRLFASADHAWLEFVNGTQSNITIGGQIIEPFDNITMGKYGGYLNAHDGIWCNKERYDYSNDKNYVQVSKSILSNFSVSKLNSINLSISQDDDYWVYGDNCVDFAVSIWNIAIDVNIDINELKGVLGNDAPNLGYSDPNKLMELLNTYDNSINNVPMSEPDFYGYYDGDTFIEEE